MGDYACTVPCVELPTLLPRHLKDEIEKLLVEIVTLGPSPEGALNPRDITLNPVLSVQLASDPTKGPPESGGHLVSLPIAQAPPSSIATACFITVAPGMSQALAGELHVHNPAWKNEVLPSVLRNAVTSLQLGAFAAFKLELRDMLEFSPGGEQAHTLNCKTGDAALGLVLVCLPSRCEGGELTVRPASNGVEGADRTVNWAPMTSGVIQCIVLGSSAVLQSKPVQSGCRVYLRYAVLPLNPSSPQVSNRAAAIEKLRDLFLYASKTSTATDGTRIPAPDTLNLSNPVFRPNYRLTVLCPQPVTNPSATSSSTGAASSTTGDTTSSNTGATAGTTGVATSSGVSGPTASTGSEVIAPYVWGRGSLAVLQALQSATAGLGDAASLFTATVTCVQTNAWPKLPSGFSCHCKSGGPPINGCDCRNNERRRLARNASSTKLTLSGWKPLGALASLQPYWDGYTEQLIHSGLQLDYRKDDTATVVKCSATNAPAAREILGLATPTNRFEALVGCMRQGWSSDTFIRLPDGSTIVTRTRQVLIVNLGCATDWAGHTAEWAAHLAARNRDASLLLLQSQPWIAHCLPLLLKNMQRCQPCTPALSTTLVQQYSELCMRAGNPASTAAFLHTIDLIVPDTASVVLRTLLQQTKGSIVTAGEAIAAACAGSSAPQIVLKAVAFLACVSKLQEQQFAMLDGAAQPVSVSTPSQVEVDQLRLRALTTPKAFNSTVVPRAQPGEQLADVLMIAVEGMVVKLSNKEASFNPPPVFALLEALRACTHPWVQGVTHALLSSHAHFLVSDRSLHTLVPLIQHDQAAVECITSCFARNGTPAAVIRCFLAWATASRLVTHQTAAVPIRPPSAGTTATVATPPTPPLPIPILSRVLTTVLDRLPTSTELSAHSSLHELLDASISVANAPAFARCMVALPPASAKSLCSTLPPQGRNGGSLLRKAAGVFRGSDFVVPTCRASARLLQQVSTFSASPKRSMH